MDGHYAPAPYEEGGWRDGFPPFVGGGGVGSDSPHGSSALQACKLFVGGISWETVEETLRAHFGVYGEVVEATLMTNKWTGSPRGFAFVTYRDPSVIPRVLADKHVLDGRVVEVKRSIPRDDATSGGPHAGLGQPRPNRRKVFIGGLPSSAMDADVRAYFSQFGPILDVSVMIDRETNRSRGFGFVTFERLESVDAVLRYHCHRIHDKEVDVRPAQPRVDKASLAAMAAGMYMGPGGGGGPMPGVMGRGMGMPMGYAPTSLGPPPPPHGRGGYGTPYGPLAPMMDPYGGYSVPRGTTRFTHGPGQGGATGGWGAPPGGGMARGYPPRHSLAYGGHGSMDADPTHGLYGVYGGGSGGGGGPLEGGAAEVYGMDGSGRGPTPHVVHDHSTYAPSPHAIGLDGFGSYGGGGWVDHGMSVDGMADMFSALSMSTTPMPMPMPMTGGGMITPTAVGGSGAMSTVSSGSSVYASTRTTSSTCSAPTPLGMGENISSGMPTHHVHSATSSTAASNSSVVGWTSMSGM